MKDIYSTRTEKENGKKLKVRDRRPFHILGRRSREREEGGESGRFRVLCKIIQNNRSIKADKKCVHFLDEY